MILIITNKQDYTADYLILRLQQRGVDFVRFNTEDFPSQISITLTFDDTRLGKSFLVIYNRVVYFDDIDSVWYRRPNDPTPSDDIQDPIAREFVIVESEHTLQATWRLLDCMWVSHPDKLYVAESKPYQLAVAAKLGFTIPRTTLTNQKKEAELFVEQNLKHVIYKPLRYGRIIREDEERVGLIYTNVVTHDHFTELSKVQYAPSMFQQYIPKSDEIRATVVGDKVFAISLLSQQLEASRDDWRRAKLAELPHIPTKLPEKIEELCVELVKALGLNFGAIDLIHTPDNEYIFLEINPNGQWAWIEQMLPELKLRDALINLLTSSRT